MKPLKLEQSDAMNSNKTENKTTKDIQNQIKLTAPRYRTKPPKVEQKTHLGFFSIHCI
jgi:hypothetical protein